MISRVIVGLLAVAVAGQTASKTQTFKNLEMTVVKVEPAQRGSLRDCPPGTNTVNAMARTGEQYSLVTVGFKVLPGFQAAPMKRPTVTAADGQTYNTSVQFVDVGSVPEYACTFPFRVPEGTKLKSLQIESVSFDLSGMDGK